MLEAHTDTIRRSEIPQNIHRSPLEALGHNSVFTNWTTEVILRVTDGITKAWSDSKHLLAESSIYMISEAAFFLI